MFTPIILLFLSLRWYFWATSGTRIYFGINKVLSYILSLILSYLCRPRSIGRSAQSAPPRGTPALGTGRQAAPGPWSCPGTQRETALTVHYSPITYSKWHTLHYSSIVTATMPHKVAQFGAPPRTHTLLCSVEFIVENDKNGRQSRWHTYERASALWVCVLVASITCGALMRQYTADL